MHKITCKNTDKVRSCGFYSKLNGADVFCEADPGQMVTFILNRYDFHMIPFEPDGRPVVRGGEVVSYHDVLTFDRDALGPDHPDNKIDEPSITMKNVNDTHRLRVEAILCNTKITYTLPPQTEAKLFCHSVESTYEIDENGEPIPQDIPPQD